MADAISPPDRSKYPLSDEEFGQNYYGQLSDLNSNVSNAFPVDITSDDAASVLPDTAYRSSESTAFLRRHVLLGASKEAISSSTSSLPTQVFEAADTGEADDQEDLDLESYTLKVRGQIIEFFTDAAKNINEMIDAKEAVHPPRPPGIPPATPNEDEALADAKIELQVKTNKKVFDQVYRPKIQEYLALIQESIRQLQSEEEELLKFCSNMYKSTCE